MYNSRQYAQYADFKKEQAELSDMISEASKTIECLHMERFSGNLSKLSETIRNDNFKVQIVGTFKNGKSTFINSLLGEEVMPAYALPCTAIVNEIKWAEEKSAVVHFRDPLPKDLPSGIPELAMAHMRKYGMRNIPPLRIPYNEIEKYAVISLNNGQDEFDFQSPYEKIEVFWPLEILKNGVEIVDSPGLNESLTRTEVTMNYIAKADAVLFVLDATRILSADEMRVIDTTIKQYGFSDPFIIINKFDAIRKSEREPMREFIHEKLSSYTDKDFFFVSALQALNGKLDGDEELLRMSGMPDFEKTLANFLVKEKGRAKLSRPIRELKRIIGEEALFKAIPMQKNALSCSVEEINGKYDSVKPRLETLKSKRKMLLDDFTRKIERSRYNFIAAATKNMSHLKESVSAWVNEYVPKTKIGLAPTKKKMTALAQEIAKYLGEKIEQDQLEWRNKELQPMLAGEISKIFDSTRTEMQEIFDGIDDIVSDISGGTTQKITSSAWQRAADLAGGIVLDETTVLQKNGGSVISPEMIVTLTTPLIAAVLMGVLNVLNPIACIAMVSVFAFGSVKSEDHFVKKVKETIKSSAVEQISTTALDFPQSFSEDISKQLNEMAQSITDSITTEINETELRIQNSIKELEKGKENVDQQKRVLDDCEEQIKRLIGRLDDLSYRLTA